MRFSRPSPSMAVASTALVVALGGTSYAAVKLPKNSVGSKQIKSNAVTSPKVRDGSLSAADFAAGQLPAGAKGDRGDRGDRGLQGEQGATGTVDTSNFYSKSASDSRFLGAGATAVNSSQVGGVGLASLVKGGGDRIFASTSSAGGASAAITVGVAGRVNVSCSDPATSVNTSFTMASDMSGSVYTDSGGTNAGYQELSANGTSTPVSGSGAPADHVTFFVKTSSSLYQVDVWTAIAPGGANSCQSLAVVDGVFS